MKKSELKKYLGKEIVFSSNRTRLSIFDKRHGTVEQLTRTEVYIAGDWHDIKSFSVLEVVDNA